MKKHSLLILIILSMVQCMCHAQHGATRLVARRTDKIDSTGTVFTPSDSSHLYYSGNRFADDNGSIQNYDIDFHWSFDSTGWRPYSSLTQTFDSSNNILTKTQRFDSAGIWITQDSDYYIYNLNNVASYHYRYNTTGDSYSETFSYDSSNNLLVHISQSYDLVDTFIGMYVFTYDSFNRIISKYNYGRSNHNPMTLFTYDTITYLSWSDTVLKITYDTTIGSLRGLDSSFFDNQNHLLFEKGYTFYHNPAHNVVDQYAYTYDGAKNLTDYVWIRFAHGSFDNESKKHWAFDSNNSLILKEIYYGAGSNAWIGLTRERYTCNNYGQFVTDKTIDLYYPDSTITFRWYEKEPTGIADKPIVDLKENPFPNPFSSGFSIPVYSGTAAIAELRLYDLFGALIDSEKMSVIPGANKIFWSKGDSLSSGIYIYSIAVGEINRMGKIVHY